MKTTKAGLHTLRALQQAAAEINARKAPARPVLTRRINDAHRNVGFLRKDEKK